MANSCNNGLFIYLKRLSTFISSMRSIYVNSFIHSVIHFWAFFKKRGCWQLQVSHGARKPASGCNFFLIVLQKNYIGITLNITDMTRSKFVTQTLNLVYLGFVIYSQHYIFPFSYSTSKYIYKSCNRH